MNPILTSEQSRAARRSLSLTQSQAIEKSGLSGYKLKQFESGFADPDGVAPFLRELRDFYEAQGYQFEDLPNAANEPQPGESVRVVRDAMVVCHHLTHSQRGIIQDRIRELLAGLQGDLSRHAEGGFFSLYSEETEAARDKAIAVLAEVGLLYATLFGNCLLKAPSEVILKAPGKVETVSDVLSLRFAEALKLTSDPNQKIKDDEGVADASGNTSADSTSDGSETTDATHAANPKGGSGKLSWMP